MFGTLVYNEILVLPFLGFDKYTKTALQRRKDLGENRSLIDDATSNGDGSVVMGYAATSPHAGYDSRRNERNV